MEGSSNLAHIAEALCLISAQGTQAEQVHQANAFLTVC
jgi:hypothetical protein